MKRLELPEKDPRPSLHYPLYETGLHKLAVWLARRAFHFWMDLRVRGVEHVPSSGPAVLVCNHLVDWDVFPLQLALPRMIYFMGKAELFQIPPLHWLFRQLGGFPVYRGERDAWALEHARKIIRSDQIVAIFPEGTRSRGKGLALAKPGAARLAIETGCPVLVVSLDGVQRLFKTFPKRAVVDVVIAPPIYPDQNDTPLSLTDKIMFTMASNLPPDLRGVYAERGIGNKLLLVVR